ncbi:YceI family protein [Roseateles cellulosilyticus]|uniref:YceI family protein n=1 Tax=Pelomonas cellulosilytica TaxID=2906762 RepID=A0ABS8Y2T4_9BURK|nr:YceI family protein [Pelomonas sp. P8]MCE4557487.1 YceI family protein [Pelomonas sp. P8]
MKTTLLLAALLATAGAAHAQSATYSLEPTHTQVYFEAKHFGTSTNRGRWDKKEGTITYDKAAKTGKVDITIDMASISTGIGPFDGHLKSKDFFAVEEFPTAKFVGDKFTFNGDKLVSVTGDLTLRGKTNPVTLTASSFNCYQNPMLKREVCGGDFEATIQRSQWGVMYGIPGIPDSVRLLIQIEAVKQ